MARLAAAELFVQLFHLRLSAFIGGHSSLKKPLAAQIERRKNNYIFPAYSNTPEPNEMGRYNCSYGAPMGHTRIVCSANSRRGVAARANHRRRQVHGRAHAELRAVSSLRL